MFSSSSTSMAKYLWGFLDRRRLFLSERARKWHWVYQSYEGRRLCGKNRRTRTVRSALWTEHSPTSSAWYRTPSVPPRIPARTLLLGGGGGRRVPWQGRFRATLREDGLDSRGQDHGELRTKGRVTHLISESHLSSRQTPNRTPARLPPDLCSGETLVWVLK